jgi:hypothetical protein
MLQTEIRYKIVLALTHVITSYLSRNNPHQTPVGLTSLCMAAHTPFVDGASAGSAARALKSSLARLSAIINEGEHTRLTAID